MYQITVDGLQRYVSVFHIVVAQIPGVSTEAPLFFLFFVSDTSLYFYQYTILTKNPVDFDTGPVL